MGFPGAATGATWNALLQTEIDDAHRGTIFGLVGALSHLSALAGTVVAGTLGSVLGPIFLLNAVQGGGYLAAGAMVLVVLRRAWLQPSSEALRGHVAQ